MNRRNIVVLFGALVVLALLPAIALYFSSFPSLSNLNGAEWDVVDLRRAGDSVRAELEELEGKRWAALEETAVLAKKVLHLTAQTVAAAERLASVKREVGVAELNLADTNRKHIYSVFSPPQLLLSPEITIIQKQAYSECTMESCFNWKACAREFHLRVAIRDNTHQLVFPVAYIHEANPCLWVGTTIQPHLVSDDSNRLSILVNDSTVPSTASNILYASSTFKSYRNGYDIVMPPLPFGEVSSDELPQLLPIQRRWLVSFVSGKTVANASNLVFVKKILDKLRTESNVFIDTDCTIAKDSFPQWPMCDFSHRIRSLNSSTFVLLIAPEGYISTLDFQTRFAESLRYGAVPVVIGASAELPFAELVKWDEIAVRLSWQNFGIVSHTLNTMHPAEIFSRRKRARDVFLQHFSNSEKITETIFGVLTQRLGLQRPVLQLAPVKIFNDSYVYGGPFQPLEVAGSDEYLGPSEEPFASLSYVFNRTQRSFSTTRLLPSTPYDPILPSHSLLQGEYAGYRPISTAQGASGAEFSLALGGGHVREQFTIVMPTYARPAVLIESLQRLRGLPYLNKVIVVWNEVDNLPGGDMPWPDIGVRVQVLLQKENSLNNRFLPFSSLETDAVLHIDDDMILRQDEIIFTFRAWRENRDRIVGFPGRFHSLNGTNFEYQRNHACQLSMVLTGAAFIHRYFMFAYHHVMPESVRAHVDKYFNCEDIAMNFLVAYLTEKPPQKVTSRWTFQCAGCQDGLAQNEDHVEERSLCIRRFEKYFGYNPLVFTQVRLDSVLFKTRVPPEHQKCFRFV